MSLPGVLEAIQTPSECGWPNAAEGEAVGTAGCTMGRG